MVKNILSIYLSCRSYNASLSKSIFLEKLRLAKLIPLFKSGSRLNPSNYRPISLLSHFSKIFEKLLCNNVDRFFDQRNVIYTEQCGFRRGYSTALPLLNLYDHLLVAQAVLQTTSLEVTSTTEAVRMC